MTDEKPEETERERLTRLEAWLDAKAETYQQTADDFRLLARKIRAMRDTV